MNEILLSEASGRIQSRGANRDNKNDDWPLAKRWRNTVANVEKVSVKRAEPYDGHVLAAISFISARRDAGTYRGDRERNLCSKWPDMHARHG